MTTDPTRSTSGSTPVGDHAPALENAEPDNPAEPTATSDHARARESWDTAVPGDEAEATSDPTLPDQVGNDFTLREAGAGEESTDYHSSTITQDGEGYARREEIPADLQATRTEASGAPTQDGDGYVKHDVTE